MARRIWGLHPLVLAGLAVLAAALIYCIWLAVYAATHQPMPV